MNTKDTENIYNTSTLTLQEGCRVILRVEKNGVGQDDTGASLIFWFASYNKSLVLERLFA